MTLDGAAKALTARGYSITKQGVGHWESGRNVPDALWLSRLAKLYGTTLDALVWDYSLSPSAMKVAVEYDHLPSQKQSDWRLLWLGFISGTAPGGEALPLPPDESADTPETAGPHRADQ